MAEGSGAYKWHKWKRSFPRIMRGPWGAGFQENADCFPARAPLPPPSAPIPRPSILPPLPTTGAINLRLRQRRRRITRPEATLCVHAYRCSSFGIPYRAVPTIRSPRTRTRLAKVGRSVLDQCWPLDDSSSTRGVITREEDRASRSVDRIRLRDTDAKRIPKAFDVGRIEMIRAVRAEFLRARGSC